MKNTQLKPVYDMLVPIIAGIDRTFIIMSVVEILPVTGGVGKWQLNSCNTRWLTMGRTITIASVNYKIVDLLCNSNIIVTGPSAPTPQNIQIYAPNFIHGTITQTVQETAQQPNTGTWLPFIFLHDITIEKLSTNPLNQTNRRVACEFYLMTERGADGHGIKDLTSEITKYCVGPMRNLAFDVAEAIKTNRIVNYEEAFDYEIEDWAKWGVYISPTGSTKNYFTENLSGTALKYEVPFIDKDICC